MDDQKRDKLQNVGAEKIIETPKKRNDRLAWLILSALILVLVLFVVMNSSVFSPIMDQLRYNTDSVVDSVSDSTTATFGAPVRSTSDVTLANSFNQLFTWMKVLAASIIITAVSTVIIVIALLGISKQLKEIAEILRR